MLAIFGTSQYAIPAATPVKDACNHCSQINHQPSSCKFIGAICHTYGTALRQRHIRCTSRARTRLEPSSLQLESRSTLGLQQ